LRFFFVISICHVAAFGMLDVDTALNDNRTKMDFNHRNCTKIDHFGVEKYQPDPRDPSNDSTNVIPCK